MILSRRVATIRQAIPPMVEFPGWKDRSHATDAPEPSDPDGISQTGREIVGLRESQSVQHGKRHGSQLRAPILFSRPRGRRADQTTAPNGRSGVLSKWRKTSFGNRSDAGAVATARLLTVAQHARSSNALFGLTSPMPSVFTAPDSTFPIYSATSSFDEPPNS